MIPGGGALEALAACLRGEPPVTANWSATFALANRTLLTPALFDALARASRLDVLPEEARAYLQFLYEQNLERNTRLRTQLIEALETLNGAGIEPMLLKGAVRLFCGRDDRMGGRMTRDLDISLERDELEAAEERLVGIGYRAIENARGMERSQDVGALELRERPVGLSSAYLRLEQEKPPRLVARAGVRARIPSSTSLALHWILHDLIKEGDYWRGRIDLRHLYDLADLATTEKDLDWTYLRDTMPDQLGRNVLETQLLALHWLFGIDIPPALRGRTIVRFHHWRRIFTAKHPMAGAPLRLAGNLTWGGKRMATVDILTECGTAEFARRVRRTLIGGRAGTKL